jgi:proline iminopeptidase
MTRHATLLALWIALAATACGPGAGPAGNVPAPPPPQAPSLAAFFAPDATGVDTAGVSRVPIQTPKGAFTVWTKRVGHNPRIKLLLLHGGPGATHEYFEALERFLGADGIEFIYYDQLGSAYSDQPTDDSLWSTERFVDEVEQVRQALGLTKENFFLLGHSWGGILAVEYALKHQEHLKGLVVSNMMMSIPDYNRYAEEVLAKGMDAKVVAEIKDLEKKSQFESPRYMELLMPNFYAKHICRLEQWPDAVNRAFAKLNKQVYVLMQGPSEFGASGRLEKWDRKADLGRITTPTLVIGATHDTMDPAHMKWVSTQVTSGSFLLCPSGSHMAMWDDQRVYASGLVRFLKTVDAGQARVGFD